MSQVVSENVRKKGKGKTIEMLTSISGQEPNTSWMSSCQLTISKPNLSQWRSEQGKSPRHQLVWLLSIMNGFPLALIQNYCWAFRGQFIHKTGGGSFPCGLALQNEVLLKEKKYSFCCFHCYHYLYEILWGYN